MKLPKIYPPRKWGKPPKGFRYIRLRERLTSEDVCWHPKSENPMLRLGTWGLGAVGLPLSFIQRQNLKYEHRGQALGRYIRRVA